jgi:hypothetical protein
MTRYFVFLRDLALAALPAQTPRRARVKDFDELLAAQNYADTEKSNWDSVFVFERTEDGHFEQLDRYHQGRK